MAAKVTVVGLDRFTGGAERTQNRSGTKTVLKTPGAKSNVTKLNAAVPVSGASADQVQKDHFITRDGVQFAGIHVLLELWGAKHLGDSAVIEAMLRDAVEAARATLLHIHLHHFGPECGVSGVAVLAESHISIHTWPERGYAAMDIFMCGAANPYEAVRVIRERFEPEFVQLNEQKRGLVS